MYLFYDPQVSRPLTFGAWFCRKFCDLYASIYGSFIRHIVLWSHLKVLPKSGSGWILKLSNPDNLDVIILLQSYYISYVFALGNWTTEKLHKESLRNESLHNESLHKESLHKESLHKESLHKESLHNESLHNESLHKESLHKESLHNESLRKESLHKESEWICKHNDARGKMNSPLHVERLQLMVCEDWVGVQVEKYDRAVVGTGECTAQSDTLQHWSHFLLLTDLARAVPGRSFLVTGLKILRSFFRARVNPGKPDF